MEEKIIDIKGKQTISSIEGIIGASYQDSIKYLMKNGVKLLFNLSELQWIGFLPACLLFSWLLFLRKTYKKSNIEVELPSPTNISNQVKKMLIDYGIISKLEENAIKCTAYIPGDYPQNGLAFNVIESKDNLFTYLQERCNNLVRRIALESTEKDIIKSVFEIIIFELVENTFNHAEGATPYFGLSYAKSSGTSSDNTGFMAVFDSNTPYIEFAVGDIGPGLNKGLEPIITDNYKPPFGESYPFLKDEKVISFAFEFSSTRDLEGRKIRINKLLGENEIDPLKIATGLFCVNEMAKTYQGQLVVRTPKAILSIDYYRNPGHPTIKGKRNLGIKKLSSLKGTHYLLRIPLVQRNLNKKHRPIPFETSYIVKGIQPFTEDVKQSENLGEYLLNAFQKIEDHLYHFRETIGISIILPPPFPLQSRALSVFITALKTMQHGKRLLVWCNSRALKLFSNYENELQNNYHSKHIHGSPLLVGDIATNQFVLIGNLNDTTTKIFPVSKLDTNTFSFNENTIKSVRNHYNGYLERYLKKIINSSIVKHENGSFLVEKKYYTSKFYEISKAFVTDTHVRRFAEWCSLHANNNTRLIITTSDTLLKLSEETASILSDEKNIVKVVVVEPPINPASASLAILPYVNQDALIITDVICRGENIQQLMSIISPLKLKKIICLVDARQKIHIGKPISFMSQFDSLTINVVSIHSDEILPYRDPPLADKIYVIDKRTNAPTLYIRPSEPTKKLEEVLKEATLKTSSLYLGHYVFDKKHYSYFLHLPRLLDAYQLEIKNWIRSQVDFFSKTSAKEEEKWEAFTYNPRGNLTWTEKVIDLLPSNFTNTILTKEDLLAPLPPIELASNDCHALIFLPAIASGETARLCIEYVSRKKPSIILVLCFMSRMDPYHRTFFSGINKYRDASLHFSFFLDLTIGSYNNETVCPMCDEARALKNVLNVMQNKTSDSQLNIYTLINLLKNKISSQQEIELEYSSSGFLVGSNLSQRDVNRAYIRALYEGAERDIPGARKQLNKILNDDLNNIDIFLEIFSFEKNSPMFMFEELDQRLYRSLHLVINRAHDILNDSTPPFPVGKYIGSIVSLIPHSFIGKYCDLVKRYLTSSRDLQEIVINLILQKIHPTLTDDIFRICRENNLRNTECLLLEVDKYFCFINKNQKISNEIQ